MLFVCIVGMAGDGKLHHIRRESLFRIRCNGGKPPLRPCAEHIYSGERHAVAERRALGGVDGECEHVHGLSSFLRGPGKRR